MIWFRIALIAVLGAATSYTDVRSRKIPNKIVLVSVVTGIALQMVQYGIIDGLIYSISGLTVGILILIIPYALGGIGAGDVKLLGAIGAVMGIKYAFVTAVFGGLIGGAVSAGYILFHKTRTEGAYGLMKWMRSFSSSPLIGIAIASTVSDHKTIRIPYGFVINLGAAVSMFIYLS